MLICISLTLAASAFASLIRKTPSFDSASTSSAFTGAGKGIDRENEPLGRSLTCNVFPSAMSDAVLSP